MRLPIAAAALSSLVALFAGGVANASPAAIDRDGAGASSAERSFQGFAGHWIDRAVERSERDSHAPRAHTASSGLVFTYRSVDDQFRTELRPTGHPSSPYVGLLHYTEHVYTCSDVKGSDCHVTSSQPQTEVFRYRDGAWGY